MDKESFLAYILDYFKDVYVTIPDDVRFYDSKLRTYGRGYHTAVLDVVNFLQYWIAESAVIPIEEKKDEFK